MKKLIALVLLLVPSLAVMAQKPIKPNLGRAEKALYEGKLEEAKTLMDATVTNQEFMVDKKGNPSKNAAKAWYLRALTYINIDTTKSKEVKALADNPLAVGLESLKNSENIDKGKTKSFINDKFGIYGIGDTTIRAIYAQHYLLRGIAFYKETKDYKNAFAEVEKVVTFLPKDTVQLMNAGVYFGPAAQDWDKSLEYIDRYFALGGKQTDAFLQQMYILLEKKKDKVKTLEISKKAQKLYPDNPEFAKYELNIYLGDKKYDLARNMVQESIKRNPEDKESFYLLGGLYTELAIIDSAKIAYQHAIDLDGTYFDAEFELSKLLSLDANKIRNERNKLGNTPADIAKRKQLFDLLQAKYKLALPYWEKCRKLQPDNETVLYTLADIYDALVMDEKSAEVRKKMKDLGYSD